MGKEIAIVGLSHGTGFVDITNPGNPVKEDDPKQTEPLNNYFVSK